MPGDRALSVVVSVIVLTAVVSGPLVGGIDFTAAGENEEIAALPAGSATISGVELPDRGQFVMGEFGAETMYLDVAPATVDVASVDGRVQLSYQVSIPAMGYTTGTTKVLGPADAGPRVLALERHAFDPERITAAEYAADLEVTVFEEAGPRRLAEKRITLTVER